MRKSNEIDAADLGLVFNNRFDAEIKRKTFGFGSSFGTAHNRSSHIERTIDFHFTLTFFMHLEHHLHTFIVGETKNLHQHIHHEIHRGFIVVVHNDDIRMRGTQACALHNA